MSDETERVKDENFELERKPAKTKAKKAKEPEKAKELPVFLASALYVQDGEFDYDGGCWCGKKLKGCTGGPVKVGKWKKYANFTCPNQRPLVSVPVQVRGAARKAGIID